MHSLVHTTDAPSSANMVPCDSCQVACAVTILYAKLPLPDALSSQARAEGNKCCSAGQGTPSLL